MIILYSITGIITALFLTIIITGAIRAHRHPERYGPRRIVGRARQSRAKGIAKAMLDTIPIVKFGGDDDDDKINTTTTTTTTTVIKGDVELATTVEEEEQPTSNKSMNNVHDETTANNNNNNNNNNNESSGNNYICPICTDDFVKGQDIRVLPCNHQFHPECIDPWLVNVSGTCPLW